MAWCLRGGRARLIEPWRLSATDAGEPCRIRIIECRCCGTTQETRTAVLAPKRYVPRREREKGTPVKKSIVALIALVLAFPVLALEPVQMEASLRAVIPWPTPTPTRPPAVATSTPTPAATVCVTKEPTGPIVIQPAIGFDISALAPVGPIVEAPDGTLRWFSPTGSYAEAWIVKYAQPGNEPGKAPLRFILVKSPDQRPVP